MPCRRVLAGSRVGPCRFRVTPCRAVSRECFFKIVSSHTVSTNVFCVPCHAMSRSITWKPCRTVSCRGVSIANRVGPCRTVSDVCAEPCRVQPFFRNKTFVGNLHQTVPQLLRTVPCRTVSLVFFVGPAFPVSPSPPSFPSCLSSAPFTCFPPFASSPLLPLWLVTQLVHTNPIH